jgi:hypothetical protein
MKHTINKDGIEYEIVIIDDAIVLQNLKQDIVFEGAYADIVEELKSEWWSQGAIGSQRAYILEYETEAILEYVKDHKGVTVINNLN